LHKLTRIHHHRSHAANAFFTSGFEDALVVTLDGYGSGLAGSISIGKEGSIRLLHELRYPHSLGLFYESITSALGFTPAKHEGKIVGLAAYGDSSRLTPAIRSRFVESEGDFFYLSGSNFLFHRYLSSRYTKMSAASAYQKVLELVSTEYIKYYAGISGLRNVALSGGVAANVKNNQRIFEIPGIDNISIHPNMGDGGCSVGAALLCCEPETRIRGPMKNAYLGPEYSESQIRIVLEEEGLHFKKPSCIETIIARLIHEGNIVARFDGRMEYGPRALGNRSILYHARNYEVNLWLNHQLGRTEFMPFAPATLYEYRHEYYEDIDGAEYPAEFMTITFACTKKMISECPAAVHVDNTARPQLVKREINPSYYRIIDEFRKLTGIATIINTSFNMHEEPIVCTPKDAVRAFKQGHLNYLAIGPFLVKG
jgi:carbamoyltransferase